MIRLADSGSASVGSSCSKRLCPKVITLPHDSVDDSYEALKNAELCIPRQELEQLDVYQKLQPAPEQRPLLPEGAAFLTDELPFIPGDTHSCTKVLYLDLVERDRLFQIELCAGVTTLAR